MIGMGRPATDGAAREHHAYPTRTTPWRRDHSRVGLRATGLHDGCSRRFHLVADRARSQGHQCEGLRAGVTCTPPYRQTVGGVGAEFAIKPYKRCLPVRP